MKIVQINRHHYIKGGAERYYFDITNLLKSKGHQVAYFSQDYILNEKTYWRKYFINNISFRNDEKSIVNLLHSFFRSLYSIEAKRNINKLLDEFKPDIIHLHGIHHHISPSILPEIRKRKIPVVMTVHDYSLLTPNTNFFHDNSICEITKVNKYYKAFFHRCVKDSYLASLATAIIYHTQDITKVFKKNIDIILTPSDFMKNKLVEYGFDGGKIIHLPNFVDIQEVDRDRHVYRKSDVLSNSYVLYFGRLEDYKGVDLVLSLAKVLSKIKFVIAGDGKQKSNLSDLKKQNNLNNVDFLGFVNSRQLYEVIFRSKFVLVPSRWYENQPYSVMESFALGRTVIATRIGGIPEIVKNNVNGLLFEVDDIKNLTEKISRLYYSPKLLLKLSDNAKRLAKEQYNSEKHYKKLVSVYTNLIS
jgi:glycosyltransferase involved in cell wall biosynthesis